MKPNEQANEHDFELIDKAVAGDGQALEELLDSASDLAFNLALRFLGTIHDAEDATQEIAVKIMTHLSSFRKESAFSTWVYRIAVNHLKDCRSHMFADAPFSFEMYGADICDKRALDVPDHSEGVDQSLLERELKLSCTNVMLQCLDAESRCIYVLGTMFRLDSRVAADILGLNPAAYRQRLSRIRKKVGGFLKEYCGLGGGGCSCKRRTNYAIATHRIDPGHLVFPGLEECSYRDIARFTDAMEELDGLSQVFADLPAYRTPEEVRDWVRGLLASGSFATVMQTEGAKG